MSFRCFKDVGRHIVSTSLLKAVHILALCRQHIWRLIGRILFVVDLIFDSEEKDGIYHTFDTRPENPPTKCSTVLTFTYSPISTAQAEIRLLRFANPPSSGRLSGLKDIICIELCHYTCANCPAYHALSYVWGSIVRNSTILVNGKKYSVTTSLHLALQRFTKDDNVKWLWADALCINQDDDVEKSAQVARMRDIYQGAQSVLAWLGSPSEGSDLLLGDIEREGKRLLRLGSSRLFSQSLVSEEPDWESLPSSECWKEFQSFSILISSDRGIMSRLAAEFLLRDGEPGLLPHGPMLDFLKRRLWTRVWLIQELAVARDVQLVCGLTKLKYAYFLAVYFFYWRFYEDQRHNESIGPNGGAFAEAISAIFPMFWQTIIALRQHSHGPLKHLLESVYRLGATDPRDRVYAVVGLANDSRLMGIKADYTKSYTDMSVELAWRLLRMDGLWVLSRAHGLRDTNRGSSLPSWVPDWSLRTHASLNGHRFKDDTDFSASGLSVMCTVPSFDAIDFHSRLIKIEGTFIATISYTGSALDFSVPRVTMRNFHIARGLIADLRRLSETTSSMSEDDLASACWQIPIAHRSLAYIAQEYQPRYGEKTEQLQQAYRVLSSAVPVPAVVPREDADNWRLEESRDYLEYVCRKSDMERPFACCWAEEKEYLGIGQQDLQPGD